MSLPGLNPMQASDWVTGGPDYPAQMDERERLLQEHPDDILAMLPEGRDAAIELYHAMAANLATRREWQTTLNKITRPDGREVLLDEIAPLETLCRLVAEDLCIMVKTGEEDEYRLTAAVLCFPGHWRLSEKLGHPMSHIHGPVPHYDQSIAKRVNRVFDALRPETPLFRINWAVVTRPDLFTPWPAKDRVKTSETTLPIYLRIERQSFVRLPKTQAIVFGIRTSIAPLEALTASEAQALQDTIRSHTDPMYTYKGGRPFFQTLTQRLESLIGSQEAK